MNEPNKAVTMEVHDLPYIAYAIGLHLQEYDPTFDTDSIDDMWERKVLPMAIEFYNSPEYKDNIYDEPFMEALNRYCNQVLKHQSYK